MKVLQLTPYFFLSWSKDRPVELIQEVSKGLVNENHGVTIYSTDVFNKDRQLRNKRTIIDGVEVFEYKSIGRYPFCLSFELMANVSKIIRNFDVVHVHEYRTFPSAIIHHYAKKNNVPYVVQAHGALQQTSEKTLMKKGYDAILGLHILRDAAGVIAVTETEAFQYESMGVRRERIAVIPNSVDLAQYKRLPASGLFKKRYSIPSHEKIVLYLGRLHETKGIDLLIRSFAQVSKEIKDVKLVIAGKDYGCETELRGLVKELNLSSKTIFTGFLPTHEKIEAFVDSDVFVIPTYFGFPHVMLESCACGTPIVTTTKGDELGWIDGNVGYVVQYGSDEEGIRSLGDAIERILGDARINKQFSQRCKEIVEEEFNWTATVKKLEQFYRKVIAEAHAT
jgi:glycosyltransferase involved in cell wall biosynthesis